jgi:hypothetical protein
MLTLGKIVGLTAALLGAVGTLTLYTGSFALVVPGSYLMDRMPTEI